MKLKNKIISGLLTATTLVSLCAFSAGAVSTDKKFSVEDATLIQKNVVGMTTFDEKQIKLYDLNKDGVITVVDSTLVQKIIVGLIKEPTEEQPTTAESTTEPTTEAVTEPTTEAVTEPTTEAVTEPATEAFTEPATEAVTEPATEAVTEPTTEAVTEPTTVPKPTTVPTGIKLNKTDIVLGTTESYALSTTVTNGNLSQVTFSTGNKKIATVDENGKITAVGVGTSKITAKTYNGKTASCTVTVKKLADSITLNKTSITLGVGEKYDLNSSIPNNTAAYYRLYYSNNTSIAPVQKAGGLVTAKTVGTTTIRCKLSNGKEAICKVTVKSAPSRVTVSDKSATLKVGQSKTLKATLNNNAYSYRSTWTSSNTYVATVNSTGKISAKSQGTATITYKTYNGKTASCKLTVSGSVVKCIDVSTWQGSIDFNKVKSAGYNYVIIRAGYGKEKSQKDNMFETNYKKAKSAGLKVGAYWFSYAMSPSTATAEADACLSCIKGKKFELPVYYDMEYQPAMSTSNSNYTKMAVNFCNKLKSNGFKSGVYSSASVYDYLLNRTTLKNNGISIWNAEWYTKPSITCDVWQYSDNGRINGISTNVDLDYIYNLNIVG
ncbi:MAG: GH25 family lysozyme [Eubacterium sp.]|uniref:GH25 family lysozyme n=1 Tax=Eubacterium sp. TaxID=142586 RepID=UPI0039A29E28